MTTTTASLVLSAAAEGRPAGGAEIGEVVIASLIGIVATLVVLGRSCAIARARCRASGASPIARVDPHRRRP